MGLNFWKWCFFFKQTTEWLWGGWLSGIMRGTWEKKTAKNLKKGAGSRYLDKRCQSEKEEKERKRHIGEKERQEKGQEEKEKENLSS